MSTRLSLRLGDYRRVLLCAFDLVDHPVALVTITGPGYDAIARDDQSAARRWNLSAAWRWRRLDRRCKARLRASGLKLRPMARIAQRQARGVDHLHLVLACEDPFDKLSIQHYVSHLKELAPGYNFGLVDDPFHMRHPKLPSGKPNRALPKQNMVYQSAQIAGRYLTRYLTGSQLETMVREGDHSFRPLWVAPSLTQASGVNCRRLRRVRHCWHVMRAEDQGSRPRLPVWWKSISERVAVKRLVVYQPQAHYF